MENLCRTFEDPFMLVSFHTIRLIMTKTNRRHLNICALFFIHQWLRESQKGTREERVGTCKCKVQEARVVPRDGRKEVLVCCVLLQSPAHRLNTSKCCVHLVPDFSNGQKIKGGVYNLAFNLLFSWRAVTNTWQEGMPTDEVKMNRFSTPAHLPALAFNDLFFS